MVLRHHLPGYADFAAFDFIESKHLRAPKAVSAEKVRERLLAPGAAGGLWQAQLKREDAAASPVKVEDPKLRVTHPFEMPIALTEIGAAPVPVLLLGKIVVE